MNKQQTNDDTWAKKGQEEMDTMIKEATWNGKLTKHLKNKHADFSAVTQAKQKTNGTKYLDEYTIIYCRVEQEQQASKGVALFLHRKWENKIVSYEYVNEHIVLANTADRKGNITLIPSEGGTKKSLKLL